MPSQATLIHLGRRGCVEAKHRRKGVGRTSDACKTGMTGMTVARRRASKACQHDDQLPSQSPALTSPHGSSSKRAHVDLPSPDQTPPSDCDIFGSLRHPAHPNSSDAMRAPKEFYLVIRRASIERGHVAPLKLRFETALVPLTFRDLRSGRFFLVGLIIKRELCKLSPFFRPARKQNKTANKWGHE